VTAEHEICHQHARGPDVDRRSVVVGPEQQLGCLVGLRPCARAERAPAYDELGEAPVDEVEAALSE
jgi:hypothetical protein